MATESVLTEREKNSIEIKKFIFHIIIENDPKPIYLDEVTLDKEQVKFFRDRFIDGSFGTQFLFTDQVRGEVSTKCQRIVDDPEGAFLDASKELATAFHATHTKATKDGVFITALISIDNKRDLLFLVKLDHRKVYEYKLKDRKAFMTEIKNSFVEDKRAIQKIAIVNPGTHYKWHVLAHDRAPGQGKIISDFFRKFLAVVERETPTTLTEKMIAAIRTWSNMNFGSLNPDDDPSAYKTRCLEYMRTAGVVDTNALIRTVTRDTDRNRERLLSKSLREYLQQEGLHGQQFAPSQSIVEKNSKKNVAKTREGLKLEWKGEKDDVNLEISTQANSDGLYEIKILTSEVVYLQ